MPPDVFGPVALTADPRFDYFCIAPPSGRVDRPLLIAIHGSERDAAPTADAFAALATKRDIGVLAPHFPVGAADPAIAEGYKFLREPEADYADVLEAMLDDLAKRHPFNRDKAFLFGFSGGAQFALRYGLVAARRLAGLIVAAPGNVTLLDPALSWWAGTGGIEAAVGRPLDLAGLRHLPVHLLVGDQDRTEGLVRRGPDDPFYSPHQDAAGATRVERLEALGASLRAAGMAVSLEQVPGAGHELRPLATVATRWLEARLR